MIKNTMSAAAAETPPEERPVSRKRSRIRKSAAPIAETLQRTKLKRSKTSIQNTANRLRGIETVRRSLELVAGTDAKGHKRRTVPGDYPDVEDIHNDDIIRHKSSELFDEPYGRDRRSYSRGEYLVDGDPADEIEKYSQAPSVEKPNDSAELYPEAHRDERQPDEDPSAEKSNGAPSFDRESTSPQQGSPHTQDRASQTDPSGAVRSRSGSRPRSTPAAGRHDAGRLRRTPGEAAQRFERSDGAGPQGRPGEHAAPTAARPAARPATAAATLHQYMPGASGREAVLASTRGDRDDKLDNLYDGDGSEQVGKDGKQRHGRKGKTAVCMAPTRIGTDGKPQYRCIENLATCEKSHCIAFVPVDEEVYTIYDEFGNRIPGTGGTPHSRPTPEPAPTTDAALAPVPALESAPAHTTKGRGKAVPGPVGGRGHKAEECLCDCAEGTCDTVCMEPPCEKTDDNEPRCFLSTWVHQCCQFLLRLLCLAPPRPRQRN